MSFNYETGKINLNNNDQVTVDLEYNYIKPIIKITPSEDIVISISDVTGNSFKINSSIQSSTDIYYVVVEGD